jgi:predicted Fe-Mo cluster-binding NifX family protein
MTSLVYAQDKEKIAVCTEGRTANAQVSRLAARCSYFLLFDRSGKLLEAVANPHKAVRRNAGSAVVAFLAQKGVGGIVAGEFGGKMVQAMKSQGVQYFQAQGDADTAVKEVLSASKKINN